MVIENYQIQCRIGRAKPTGRFEVNRFGKRKPILTWSEEYETLAGTFSPAAWKEKAIQTIEADGQTNLLEKIKRYCKEHCVWLKTESDLEEHAIDCLCGRSYKHWPDFKE